MHRIDQLVQLDNHENYFRHAKNMCFTSLDLKVKRIMAYLLRKLSLIPDGGPLVIRILTALLESWTPLSEKVETEFIRLLENNCVSSEDRARYTIRLYKWFMDVFKKSYDKVFSPLCLKLMRNIVSFRNSW